MNTSAPKPGPQKPNPLGRGLSALFGDADASYQAPAAKPVTGVAPITRINGGEVGGAKSGGMQKMPVGWLKSGRFQPRNQFNDDALGQLADSIRERGILEPLLVRALPDARDSYEIIAGERRWRAAQLAGLHEVPVMVRDLSDREALEFGIIENVQREDLSPLEEGEGYKRLIDEFGHTQEALAKIVGKSRPHINSMMRILTLPAPVLQMIVEGKLTSAHARALVPTKNPVALAEEIVRKGLNSKQAEALAKRAQENPEIHKTRDKTRSADIIALERDIEKHLGLKVTIAFKGQGGSLTLNYTSLDQLDGIIGILMRKLPG